MTSPKWSAALLAAILVSALVSVSLPHDARAQSQGTNYILSGAASAFAESTSQCAGLGGSWSNSTATCTISGEASLGSGGNLGILLGAALTISKGATFANSGSIENNGTMTNTGTLENDGLLSNPGTFSSSGSIVDAGTIANEPSGIFTNSGTLEIETGALVTNFRDFYNAGAITNSGSFTNSCQGSLYETGSFTGNPPVFCGTTSALAQSTPTGAPASGVQNTLALEALLGLATVIVIALLLWRGGVIRRAQTYSKERLN